MSSSPTQPPTQELSSAHRANLALRGIFGNETLAYIVKRLLQAFLTLLLASFLSFMVVQLAPGDFLTPFRSDPEFPRELLDRKSTRLNSSHPV